MLGHLVRWVPGSIRKSAAGISGGFRPCATDLQLDTRADYEPLTDASVVYAQWLGPRPLEWARISGAEEIGRRMPVIKLKDNEPFEVAMKRFKKQVEKAGILTELRRREYFDKPSVRKKKKAAAAKKRALKRLKRMVN